HLSEHFSLAGMTIDNDRKLMSTSKTFRSFSGAFRRSIRRFSLFGRVGDQKSYDDRFPESDARGDHENENSFAPEPSDYRIRSKNKDTLIINASNLPQIGSYRVKQRPIFTSRTQPLGTIPCELASHDNHFSGYISLVSVQSTSSITFATHIDNPCELIKLTSFEKRRRQNQDYAVALHAKQSLFCPEQASQIEFEIITLSNKDFLVQISAPNGEKSPPLSILTSQPARFSPSNVGCGHGIWRLEVFEREQAKFVPKTT
ncbi:hypothetical protein PRIPAC_97490, partial [Pristionchus pacificus]